MMGDHIWGGENAGERGHLAFLTSTPTAAQIGKYKLYFKEDGVDPVGLFYLDSAGTECRALSSCDDGPFVDTFRFTGIGPILVTTNFDGVWTASRPGKIIQVSLHREDAGNAGSAIIDINKNGTTIFTTQTNRPEVTAASGDDQTDTTIEANIEAGTFVDGDNFKADVDQREAGSSRDVSVTVTVKYDA